MLSKKKKRIVIFAPNPIGDAVMATPCLKALREFYRNEEIIIVCHPVVASLYQGLNFSDKIWNYSRKSIFAKLQLFLIFLRMLLKETEISIHLTNDYESAFISTIASSKKRLGYDRRGRGFLLSDKLIPAQKDKEYLPISAVDYYLDLIKLIGCQAEEKKLELKINKSEIDITQKVLNNFGIKQTDKIVVISNSTSKGTAKLWPNEYFAKLAIRILEEIKIKVIIICGPEDKTNADEIYKLVNSVDIFTLSRANTSIGLAKGIISKAKVVVCTDSGPRHIAASLNIPSITLFGPTKIQWSENYFDKEKRIQKTVDCGPCSQWICPEGHHKCMKEITVEEVFNNLLEIIK